MAGFLQLLAAVCSPAVRMTHFLPGPSSLLLCRGLDADALDAASVIETLRLNIAMRRLHKVSRVSIPVAMSSATTKVGAKKIPLPARAN